MAMKVARRPTTTPSASIWIHFLSTSDGFKAAVVLFSIFEVPGIDETGWPAPADAGTNGRRADRGRDGGRQCALNARIRHRYLILHVFSNTVLKYRTHPRPKRPFGAAMGDGSVRQRPA